MPQGESAIRRWFEKTFTGPTPAQSAAWPVIESGAHTLVISPTGTGKTLAAFLSILHQLDVDHRHNRLPSGIQALYISPLRALAYDLGKNLQRPLVEAYSGKPPLRVALRTGDTPATERQKQFDQPPHILLTTPESLGLLLSQSRWLPHLSSIRWVVVDEVHALATNKRGSDLSLCLERLQHACLSQHHPAPQRIGLSATVSPAADVAAFLAGARRPCQIVEVPSAKRIDLAVHTPLHSHPYPAAGFTGVRLMSELARLIDAHQTTLVFTNTRSGAEAATFWLRDQRPDLANVIECHHGSLDRDLRLDVEDRLKRGELRAVVCSSSLELGIDIGSVDLVVMLATPKGVTRALQRTGRAGHRIDQVSHGILMATNVGDLVECCATAKLARAGHLDTLRIPEAPLDVLAQHLTGIGCLGEWTRDDAFALVTQAWPFRELSRADFDATLDYLAGGGQALRRQYTEVFGRIHLSDSSFETRAGNTRRDFLQNIGTIATDGVVRVLHRNRQLGTVEEGFLRQLRPGDVFSLAGRPLRIDRFGPMECHVSPAEGQSPTVPRWGNNKFPLANRVAHEIRLFRRDLRRQFESQASTSELIRWIDHRLECGPANAAILHRVHAAQHGISEIPADASLLIEEFDEPAPPSAPAQYHRAPPLRHREAPPRDGQLAMASIILTAKSAPKNTPTSAISPDPTPAPPTLRHYFFHSLIGRAANDALSRVVGFRIGRSLGINPVAAPDDYGFALSIPPDHRLDPETLRKALAPESFEDDLAQVLRRSALLQYHFRTAAQTGLMIWRSHFGQQKSARKLQWSAEVIFNVLTEHEPDHILLREARRDAGHAFLDEPRAIAWLKDFDSRYRPIALRPVPRVPPLSFQLYISCIREALLVEEPRETIERLFHQWWSELDPDSPGG